MALSNLRPGLLVRQERITNRPDVAGTTLPAVFIGVNRRLVFQQKADLTDWSASSAVNGIEFPEYGGGTVESGSAYPELMPRFYVQNTLGIGEILSGITITNVSENQGVLPSFFLETTVSVAPTVTFVSGTGTPTFNLSSGISAVFKLMTGTSGVFTVNTSDPLACVFKDLSADFVLKQVSRGDVIKVGGVPTYEVSGIVSDSQLAVRRRGKGPESIAPTEASKFILSAEDANDLRTFTVTSPAFEEAGGFSQTGTKVNAGHIVRIDNWLVKESSGGLVYGYEGEQEGETIAGGVVGATERVVTYPEAVTDAVWNNSGGTGSIIFAADADRKLVPTFYVVGVDGALPVARVKAFAGAGVLPAADEDIGAAWKHYNYALRVTTSTSGSFTELQEGDIRTFTDVVSMAGTQVGDHIAVKDSENVYRPIFVVETVVSNTELEVSQFSELQLASNLSANNVSYKILNPGSATGGGTAVVSETYGELGEVTFEPLITTNATTTGAIVAGLAVDYDNYEVQAEDRVLTVDDAGVKATAVITVGAYSSIAAGDTVTISDGVTQITYEFVINTAATSVDAGNYPVLVGDDGDGTLTNLLAAITTASSSVTFTTTKSGGTAANTFSTAVNNVTPVLPALNLTGAVTGTGDTGSLTLTFPVEGAVGNLASVVAISNAAGFDGPATLPTYFSGGVGNNFANSEVEVGDFIFSDTGVLMFQVVAVPTNVTVNHGDPKTLIVRTVPTTATTIEASETLSDFGFSIRTNRHRADYVVRRVINETTLEVKELSTSPNTIPGTQPVFGGIWFQDGDGLDALWPISVESPDSAAGISYTVEKTLSAGDLTGDILVSYAEVRNDLNGLTEVTAETYEDVVGPAVPHNPLGLAVEKYFINTAETAYVVQVAADNLTGWTNAAEAAKVDTVYNIVPLTQHETVLGMWRAHVAEESLPENKRERRLWQSHRFLTEYEKATKGSTETLVSRTAGGTQTVEVSRDLVAESVVIGDDFAGEWFNGSITTAFTGRITAVSLLGSTTTLTMLPDGNVPTSTTDQVVTSFTIKSRPVSQAELRDEIAAYAEGISSRRVVNIFPDKAQVQFTDSTGFYGGGIVSAFEVGGEYYAAIEVAKRAQIGPALPLTGRGGIGIYKVLDTFKALPGYQDTVLDAGNYYMSQLGAVNTTVSTLRALSTDTTDLSTAEESVTSQIDSFVRLLRAQLKPFLGPHVMDSTFFDLISAQQQAVVSKVLNRKELRDIKLVSMRESDTASDTFLMIYNVTPLFSGARGDITIRF